MEKNVEEDMKLKGMKVGDCANKPRWRKGLKMGLQRSGIKLIVEVQYRKGLRRHETVSAKSRNTKSTDVI